MATTVAMRIPSIGFAEAPPAVVPNTVLVCPITTTASNITLAQGAKVSQTVAAIHICGLVVFIINVVIAFAPWFS